MILRRLLNFVTLLSLLMALVALGMWGRSQFVVEGWESKPQQAGIIYAGEGWHRQWAVESAGGRFVYVNYRIFISSTDPPIPGGYQRSAEPLTPLRQSRHFPRYPDRYVPTHTRGEIRGVVEWCDLPGYYFYPPGRFVGVSWLALSIAFGVVPAVRGGWRWWRWRQSSRPGFPVSIAGSP